MTVHQKRVADSFHRFVEYLALNEIDWHLGLVSSDITAAPGQYQGSGKLYFAASDSNVEQAVGQAVEAPGTAGGAVSPVARQGDPAPPAPPAGFFPARAAPLAPLAPRRARALAPGGGAPDSRPD